MPRLPPVTRSTRSMLDTLCEIRDPGSARVPAEGLAERGGGGGGDGAPALAPHAGHPLLAPRDELLPAVVLEEEGDPVLGHLAQAHAEAHLVEGFELGEVLAGAADGGQGEAAPEGVQDVGRVLL